MGLKRFNEQDRAFLDGQKNASKHRSTIRARACLKSVYSRLRIKSSGSILSKILKIIFSSCPKRRMNIQRPCLKVGHFIKVCVLNQNNFQGVSFRPSQHSQKAIFEELWPSIAVKPGTSLMKATCTCLRDTLYFHFHWFSLLHYLRVHFHLKRWSFVRTSVVYVNGPTMWSIPEMNLIQTLSFRIIRKGGPAWSLAGFNCRHEY